MKYTIMQYNGHFLEIIKKGLTEEEVKEFGLIERFIYADYDKKEQCGYILMKNTKKYYAIKEK